MANARSGNVIYIDSSGSVTDEKGLRVAHIIFTTSGANDAIEIRDSSSGTTKFYAKHVTANDTKHFSLDTIPIYFANGIYVQSLSSGAKAILITTGASGG